MSPATAFAWLWTGQHFCKYSHVQNAVLDHLQAVGGAAHDCVVGDEQLHYAFCQRMSSCTKPTVTMKSWRKTVQGVDEAFGVRIPDYFMSFYARCETAC